MKVDEIIEIVLKKHPGLVKNSNWGEMGIFYNPEGKLKNGWMSWICVINPSKKTFEKLKPLITEGYMLAIEKYSKRRP